MPPSQEKLPIFRSLVQFSRGPELLGPLSATIQRQLGNSSVRSDSQLTSFVSEALSTRALAVLVYKQWKLFPDGE